MAFKARFNGGKCTVCGGAILKGQEITWARKGEKGIRHLACIPTEAAEPLRPIIPVSVDPIAPQAIPEASSNGNGAKHVEPQEEKGLIEKDNTALDLLAEALQTRLKVATRDVMDYLEQKLDSKITDLEKRVAQSGNEAVTQLIKLEISQSNATVVEVPNAHYQLESLVKLLAKRKHVYLHGAPGGGKSKNCELAATALGLKFGYISLDEQSPDYLVTGYCDAAGNYHQSGFVTFYRSGGVFCIEEMDNASGSLLTALNCALENGHLSLPNGELVERHPDFVLVACGNTAGRGAHPAFPERRPFDAAFAARFFFLEWRYDWKQAEAIALAINDKSKPLVTWSKKASAFAEENAIRVVISPREAFTLASLVDSGLGVDLLFAGIMRGLDDSAKNKILENVPFPDVVTN